MEIKIKNVLVALFEKDLADFLIPIFLQNSIKVFGTEGTVNYMSRQGFSHATSVVTGFDFDGRVKTLSRENFVRVLADSSRQTHLDELKKEGLELFDAVIIDLYEPDEDIFPESMDIGGQAMLRAAAKNYKNVALAYDKVTISELISEMTANSGSTTLEFRKAQAKKAAKFIAERTKLEADLFEKV